MSSRAPNPTAGPPRSSTRDCLSGFPADYRAAFVRLREAGLPLGEALPALVRPDGVAVVLSGLDYDTLRLTPRSAILKL